MGNPAWLQVIIILQSNTLYKSLCLDLWRSSLRWWINNPFSIHSHNIKADDHLPCCKIFNHAEFGATFCLRWRGIVLGTITKIIFFYSFNNKERYVVNFSRGVSIRWVRVTSRGIFIGQSTLFTIFFFFFFCTLMLLFLRLESPLFSSPQTSLLYHAQHFHFLFMGSIRSQWQNIAKNPMPRS